MPVSAFLLLVAPAVAAPPANFPSRFAVEAGWRHPGLSNGAAWGDGLAVRATAEWGDPRSYAVQVVYGLALHPLTDPNALFSQPPTVQGWEGLLQQHTVRAGVRVQPEQLLGSSGPLTVWAASTVGLCASDVVLGTTERPDLIVERVHLQPDMDLSAGLDLHLGGLALAPVVRASALPGVLRDPVDGSLELRLFASVGAGLQVAWDPQGS